MFGVKRNSKPKKQIINSRLFGNAVTLIEDIQDALAYFVSNAAKKLCDQHSIAGMMQVFIQIDRIRSNTTPSVSIPLVAPSPSISLHKHALAGLRSIYREGFQFKKAGVILSEISDESTYQGDLFAVQSGTDNTTKVMDAMNARYGNGTIRLSRDSSRHSWKMRQENKSPEYTTNFYQLPECS